MNTDLPRLWLTPPHVPGPAEYFWQPGTDVCLRCPVSYGLCNQSDSRAHAIRQRKTKPDCPLSLAIWHGLSAAEADDLARQTLNPDNERSAQWFERTVIQTIERRQCLADLATA